MKQLDNLIGHMRNILIGSFILLGIYIWTPEYFAKLDLPIEVKWIPMGVIVLNLLLIWRRAKLHEEQVRQRQPQQQQPIQQPMENQQNPQTYSPQQPGEPIVQQPFEWVNNQNR